MFNFDITEVTRGTGIVEYVSSFPMTDYKSMIIGNIFYFVTIYVLMQIMNRREERFNPKKFMIVYNFICVCLATYCFYGMLRYYYLDGNVLSCSNIDFSSEKAKQLVRVFYVFYIQKYWEFLDTFIFILRKSYRQVTFLHVYHHSSITIMVRLFLFAYPNGDNCVPVLLNSFVHMLMYTHYLCSIMGFKCWWRSYLTKLQLVQFVLITLVNVVDLVKGNCQMPHWLNWLLIAYMATMIVLFSRFYIKRYLGGNEEKPKSA